MDYCTSNGVGVVMIGNFNDTDGATIYSVNAVEMDVRPHPRKEGWSQTLTTVVIDGNKMTFTMMMYDPANGVYDHRDEFHSGLHQGDSCFNFVPADEPNTPYIGKVKSFNELYELIRKY